MSNQANSLETQWRPPERPEWVKRINEEGACMDISGCVPLDESSLIDAAMRSTGLSDFGATDWLEPFRVYIKALEDEAQLNLLGRLRVRQEILLFLQARLQIEDTYKRHPEIEEEEIRKAIFITGQGRSGTSFLQNVLAANPDYGTLRHWEMLFPCPPPEKATYATDPRIEKAAKWVSQWNRVVPTLKSMHDYAAEVPFECTMIHSISFLSDGWLSAFGQVPSFHAWIAHSVPVKTFQFHRRVLKLLQWKNPRRHWVLKDVQHLSKIEALFKVYPDACVAWPHRDPVRATSSFISLIGTLQWAGSDTPLRPGALELYKDPAHQAVLLNQVIDLLEQRVIPSQQVCNIHYKDLVADTMGTLETMHEYFDIPLSSEGRAGMLKYLTENPRDSRPPHQYPIASGQALAHARQVYKRYQDYFGVPTE